MDGLDAITYIGADPINFDVGIDLDWVNAFNRTLDEHTLNWASHIKVPEIGKSGFDSFYKLSDGGNDALYVAPLEWNVRLSEYEITSTLVQYLSHSDTAIRYDRVTSVLSALNFDDVLPLDGEKIRVFSEYAIPEGRIDILIAWGQSSKKARFQHGIIVEVKKGAILSDGQLTKYENSAHLISDTTQFAFLCKSFSSGDVAQLNASKRQWACSEWWAFLRRMETKLGTDSDNLEFRQFRSTLWEQTV